MTCTLARLPSLRPRCRNTWRRSRQSQPGRCAGNQPARRAPGMAAPVPFAAAGRSRVHPWLAQPALRRRSAPVRTLTNTPSDGLVVLPGNLGHSHKSRRTDADRSPSAVTAAPPPGGDSAISVATVAGPSRAQAGRQRPARRSSPTARATAGSSSMATAVSAARSRARGAHGRRTPPALRHGCRDPASAARLIGPTRRPGGSSHPVTYARHPCPVHPKGGTAKEVIPPPRRDRSNLTVPWSTRVRKGRQA